MKEKKFKMDEEWVDVPEGVVTFGALLGWILNHWKSRDRVLLGVLHGEVSVNHKELDAWEMRPIGEFDVLEFLSADSIELARHTCGDLASFMEKLGRRAEGAVREYEAGEEEKAASGFGECMEGWGMVLEAYWNIISLGDFDPSIIEIDGRTLSSIVAGFKDSFGKMAGDYGKGDMKAVKDHLSEEMVLYVAPMCEAFEYLQEKLEKATA